MKKIFFIADGHSYWLDETDHLSTHKIPEKQGLIKKLSSVSGFYGRFFPEYDRNYWLTYKSLQACDPDVFAEIKKDFKSPKPNPDVFFPHVMSRIDSDSFFDIRQEMAEFWEFKMNNSSFLGTQFHYVQEQKAKDQGFVVNCWTGEKFDLVSWDKRFDNESYSDNLMDLPDGAYVELLLFNLDKGLAGQIDQCFIKTIKKKRYFWLNDFKTNEKIDKSSLDRGLDPISHLNASKHTKYSMQASIYAWMLKSAGFIPVEIGYTKYKNFDENCYENVKVEPFFDEIQKMFEKSA
jgi:hypothetical protein